jgi:hypothetical protein
MFLVIPVIPDDYDTVILIEDMNFDEAGRLQF